jgi:hypothetical protein
MKNLKPILYAGAIVGALDITAACIQTHIEFGMPPLRVLKDVAGGLLGRGAYQGGFTVAAIGLAMASSERTLCYFVLCMMKALFSLRNPTLG